MTQPVESLDDLITGIKQLLSENRYSFSDEQKALLTKCISVLEEAKVKNDIGLMTDVINTICKVFVTAGHLSDLF